MKKLLLIGSALTLISTSAMASQARLLALGMNETDNEGMYHISDARNMFLNPAYINVYNNQAIFEWGDKGQYANASTGTANDATLNSDASPKAQGGVLAKSGDFVYGLYVGNESNTSSLLRVAGTSAFASLNGFGGTLNSKMLATSDNQVDFFFGGGSDLKWAVNPVITLGKNDARKSKDSGISLRSGVIGSNWDAHINLSLSSKSEANESVTVGATTANIAQEFKGKAGVQVGGSYVFSGNNRAFGYVKHYGWEQKDNFAGYAATDGQAVPTGFGGTGIGGQQGTVKGDFTSYYLGWGSHTEIGTSDKLFYSFAAKKTDINLKFSNKGEIRHLVIPVTVGYEAVATEWLTLRGSIVQNIWGQQDNKNVTNYTGATGSRLNRVAAGLISNIYGGTGKKTIANSTVVSGGATLTYGKLAVDGLVSAKSASGTLTTDDLMSRVGVTYNF